MARPLISFVSTRTVLSCPRQTLFAFEADATALAPEVLRLGFEDEYEELEADLQEFSEKFADSPVAQVSSVLQQKLKVSVLHLVRVCVWARLLS